MTTVKTKKTNKNSMIDLFNQVFGDENKIRNEDFGTRLIGLDSINQRFPRIDISENKDHYTMKAEVPGFNKKDMEVRFKDNVLTIRGKRNNGEKNTKTIHRERFNGEFVRHFSLLEQVNSDQVHAKYQNGILSVVIPKHEGARRKEIKIEK